MSSPAEALKDLLNSHPLPKGWELGERVFHQVEMSRGLIHLVGLVAVHGEYGMISGSAGSMTDDALPRAYFELIERISIIEAEKSERMNWMTRDIDRTPLIRVSRGDIFPQSESPKTWQFSKSNGVALGTDYETTARRAFFELLERDRLLRSWYGAQAPLRMREEAYRIEGLGDYEVETYRFGSIDENGTGEVCGIFAFPESPSRPFVYGLGAESDFDSAFKKAESELYQRLGFLLEEEIPSDLPSFEPTPIFHQELYLYPPMQKTIRKWLSGGFKKNFLNVEHELAEEVTFVDITPASLKGRYFVIKAYSEGMIPLTFGRFNPTLKKTEIAEEYLVHPIA